MKRTSSHPARGNCRALIVSLLSFAILTMPLASVAATPPSPIALAATLNTAPAKSPAAGGAKDQNITPPAEAEWGILSGLHTAAAPLPLVNSPTVTAILDDGISLASSVAPAGTINYTVTVANASAATAAADNVQFNATVDTHTTVSGTIKAGPLAIDHSYSAAGNTQLSVDAASGLKSGVTDVDGVTPNASLMMTAATVPTSAGGSVTINADGSFTYTPQTGDQNLTDTFSYTVTDGDGLSGAGLVSINLGRRVWFLDSAYNIVNGASDGSSLHPFRFFSEVTGATGPDIANDIFFVKNSGSTYNGNMTLLNGQELYGGGATLTVNTVTINTAGTNTSIGTTAASTSSLTLSSGNNTVKGFTIGNTTGAKIFGNAFGTLTLSAVTLSGTGQALNLTSGTLAVVFDNITTTSAPAAAGINLNTLAGSLTVSGTTTVSNSGAQGINISGSSLTASFGTTNVSSTTTQAILIGTTSGNITFGATTITGGTDAVSLSNNSAGMRTFGSLSVNGNTGIGFLHSGGGGATLVSGTTTITPVAAGTAGIDIQNAGTNAGNITFNGVTVNKSASAGTGINISGTNAGRTITFGSLSITTSAGTALSSVSTGGTISSSGGTISATGGGAIIASGVAFNAGSTLTSASASGGTMSGISLTGVSGSMTVGGGTLTGNASASTFAVNGGTVAFTYSGGITQASNAAMVSISGGHNTGTITFQTGTLSATNGTGLQFDNADGAYNFNGTTALNGGNAGIDILNDSAGTFGFGSSATVASPSGIAFNVNKGAAATCNPTVTYAGTITQNTSGQRAVNIDSTTGGSISFTGTVTSSSTAGGTGSTGVNINAANGNVSFTALNIGTSGTRTTNQAVTITGGSGTYSLGTVGIFTTGSSGVGIGATNSTGVIVSSSGTVDASGAAAISISGASAASKTPLNMQLTKVSTNGGSNGIVLQNTSATGSPGGFRVLGSGGSCTIATPTCTGGLIDNSTSAGISLTSAAGVVLTRVRIRNSGFHGINATGATDLTLNSSYLQTNGNGDDENSLHLGSVTGTVIVDATSFLGAAENLVRVNNNNANLTFTVRNGSWFEYPNPKNSAFANSAILITWQGSSAITASVQGNTFKNIPVSSFQFGPDSSATATSTATFSNNTLSADLGLNVSCASSTECRVGNISVGGSGGTINFIATGNTFNRVNGDGVFIMGANFSSTLKALVQNNSISNAMDDAFVIGLGQNAREILQFDGNTISNIGGDAFEVASGETNTSFGTGSASDMDLVITNNTMASVGQTSSLAGTGGPGIYRFGDADQELCVAFTGNSVSGNGVAGTDAYFDGNFGVLGGNIKYEGAGSGAVNAAKVHADNPGIAQANIVVSSVNLSNGVQCQRPGLVAPSISLSPGGGIGGPNWLSTQAATAPTVARDSGTSRLFLSLPRTEATTDTAPKASARNDTASIFVGSDDNTVWPAQMGAAVRRGGPERPVAREVQAVLANTGEGRVWGSITATPRTEARTPGNADAVYKRGDQAHWDSEGITKASYRLVAKHSNGDIAKTSGSAGDSRLGHANVRSVSNGGANTATATTFTPGAPPACSNTSSHVCQTIGTLPIGSSVQLKFSATVNNPPNLSQLNPPKVSVQGTVTGDNAATSGAFATVNTDDPETGTAGDSTSTVIDLYGTTTSLISNLNPSDQGGTVTLTATVAAGNLPSTPPGGINPTGTMTFKSDGADISGCVNVSLTSGQAQCQTSTLTPAGSPHTITAVYSGDGNFDSSTSNTVSQTVTACANNPIVNSTADNGVGTLREALGNVCAAPNNNITFNLGAGAHTITLTTGPLVVSRDANITNTVSVTNGALTISGGGISRVFNINSGITASIDNLTITNGLASGAFPANAGGAILNDHGTLTIINSTVSGSTAGFGGGIYNAGHTGGSASLTIINSTLSGNTVVNDGGAIYNDGNSGSATLTLTNSTLSGNNAGGNGGGVYAGASTGSASATITNSTITNNRVDNDTNSTGQGGGLAIFSGSSVILRNSIAGLNLVGGSPSTTADDIFGSLDVANSTFNLVGSCSGCGLSDGTSNNELGLTASELRLGALANNGGPTQTHALLAGSMARDAGNNAFVVSPPFFDVPTITDQRGAGFPRIADAEDSDTVQTVDIGAFEADPSVEDISDKTTAEDTALPQFSFNVGDAATAFDSITAVATTNPTLVGSITVGPGADTSKRTLDITPAADQSGTATITVTVTKTISGTPVSMTDTFVLTVTEVNDAPTANADAIPGIAEDSGIYTIPIASLLGNDSTGPANEAAQTLVVKTVSNPVGGTVIINGTNVEFTPTANYNGPASFDYTVEDNGTTNGAPDPQVSAAAATVSFTIDAVNDAPSFTKGPDQTASGNAPQTITNWATNILAGPPDEAGQTVMFNITNNTNPALFSTQPSIDPSGTLTFTPIAGVNGTATITVELKDNGGVLNGGIDTSAPQTFNITVSPTGWTTTGDTGATEDESNPARPTFTNFTASPIAGTPAGTYVLRYNITAMGNLTSPGAANTRLRVRFRDEGAGSRVIVAIIQSPISGGATTIGTLFDSDTFAAGSGFQTQEILMPALVFDFAQNTYWLEVTMTKAGTADQPGLGSVQINQQ